MRGKKVKAILTDYGKIPLIAVLSWILFDMANSFLQVGVTSLYYPLWIIQDMGVKELHYSIVLAIAQLIVILSSPVLGALSDQHHKKKLIFTLFTLQAILFTAMLKVGNTYLSLMFFLLVYIGIQISQIFYDSFLVDVSTKKSRGIISGIGIAFGQLGNMLILLLMIPIVARFGRSATFIPMSILFFICALPAFLTLREKTKKPKTKQNLGINSSVTRVFSTLRNLKKYQGTLRFFVSRFFYLDSLSTVYVFGAVYLSSVMVFTDTEIQIFAAFALVFAVIGALVSGFFINRIGPKRFLVIILILFGIGLGTMAIANHKPLVFFYAIILGLAQGGVWSVDRVIITKLSPRKQLGEFFGLYGMINRFATMIGPIIWGSVVFVLEGFGSEIAHRVAMGSVVILLIISIITLVPLKIPEQTKTF